MVACERHGDVVEPHSLVATVPAFAAARVANPVVALFDNDTAASDAL